MSETELSYINDHSYTSWTVRDEQSVKEAKRPVTSDTAQCFSAVTVSQTFTDHRRSSTGLSSACQRDESVKRLFTAGPAL